MNVNQDNTSVPMKRFVLIQLVAINVSANLATTVLVLLKMVPQDVLRKVKYEPFFLYHFHAKQMILIKHKTIDTP